MLTTFALVTGMLAPQQADPALKPIPELRVQMAQDADDTLYRVYAVLDERMTLQDFRGEVDGLRRGERQAYVAGKLQAFAAPRQAGLISLLEELEMDGDVARVTPLWITNAVVFQGTEKAIDAVSQLEEVSYIGWDPVRDESAYQDIVPAPPVLTPPTPAAGGVTPEPNLIGLQAPDLWNLGFTGQNTVILNIDSGCWPEHPDLVNRIWQNPADPIDGLDNDNNGYVDDIWGWDFSNNDNWPNPSGTHGTNTGGIMVGDGSQGVFLTGMAPGASMAVARISGESDHWAAQQWGISVGIDCSSSSHSYKWNFSPKPDYAMNRSVEDMVLAAGIIHANSIGNQGGSSNPAPPFQISAPGLSPNPWKHPDQTQADGGTSGVMACGGILLPDDAYYSSSSIGPSAWEDIDPLYTSTYQFPQNPDYWDYPAGGFPPTLQGLLKPDMCTYTNVVTTSSGTGYSSSFGGTSAATPHLGGAMALLISAQPAAPPRHIAQALQITAGDLGDPGKDNFFGAGKVQVRDAALRLFHGVASSDIEPNAGDTITLDIYGFAGESYFTTFGFATGTTSTPFGNLSIDNAVLLQIGTLDGSGSDSLVIGIPNDPFFQGLDVFLQSVEDNTGGVTGQMLFSVVEQVSIN